MVKRAFPIDSHEEQQTSDIPLPGYGLLQPTIATSFSVITVIHILLALLLQTDVIPLLFAGPGSGYPPAFLQATVAMP
jgi:hypothetical protein